MKIIKKIISLTLALVLCVSLCIPAFAEGDGKKINYLVLGDSIANGYGLMNSESAVYGKIVADTNGYSYINESYGGGETTATRHEGNRLSYWPQGYAPNCPAPHTHRVSASGSAFCHP